MVILNLTRSELEVEIVNLGMPKFTARQILEWIYVKHVRSFDEMTNISVKNRQCLKEYFLLGLSDPVEERVSKDGTRKYLFKKIVELEDAVDANQQEMFFETVLIPERDRATLCVSSQVGCKMNCAFCGTGKQGFQANLSVADILNQVLTVDYLLKNDSSAITNIVFMGQGEPLDNYTNVSAAITMLTADYGYAWSPKRITVSTIGLKKNIKNFLQNETCHLAVSLHFPFHEQRLKYMPAERQYSIEDLIDILRQYDFSHQRRLSFEYIMFDGVNDDLVFAKELLKLLRGLECRVNLIPFHKIPELDLSGTTLERMEHFRDYLTHHGLFATIRRSRGEDIEAACGLLRKIVCDK